MTALLLPLVKEFGLPVVAIFLCVIVLFRQKDKVEKDQCSKSRAALYEDNKEILQVLNDQKSTNEREFGEIQSTLKAIDKNLDRMNGVK